MQFGLAHLLFMIAFPLWVNLCQNLLYILYFVHKKSRYIRDLKVIFNIFLFHPAELKCMDERGHTLRTGILPGETVEVHGQNSHHSARFLHATYQTTPYRLDYKQIKWPSTKSKCEWHQFDEDVNEIIRTTSKGNSDKRLKIPSTIIVNIPKKDLAYVKVEKKKPTVRTVGQRKYRT